MKKHEPVEVHFEGTTEEQLEQAMDKIKEMAARIAELEVQVEEQSSQIKSLTHKKKKKEKEKSSKDGKDRKEKKHHKKKSESHEPVE